MVNLGEYLTSNSVSFNSYEKRLGLKSSRVDLLGSVQHLKGIGKKGIKRYKLDKKVLNRMDENCTLPDISSDMDFLETGSNVSERPAVVNNLEKSSPEHHSEPNRFPGRETIDRIRRGWNVEEANTITVGDLFLMVCLCIYANLHILFLFIYIFYSLLIYLHILFLRIYPSNF